MLFQAVLRGAPRSLENGLKTSSKSWGKLLILLGKLAWERG